MSIRLIGELFSGWPISRGNGSNVYARFGFVEYTITAEVVVLLLIKVAGCGQL